MPGWRYSMKPLHTIRDFLISKGFPADIVLKWNIEGLQIYSPTTRLTAGQKSAMVAARTGFFGGSVAGEEFNLLEEEEVT